MTQKDLKQIGQNILKEFEITNIPIKYKDVQRGRSTRRSIIIPKWSALERGEAYSLYYVLHEVSHQVLRHVSKVPIKMHGKEFKDMEGKLLARYDLVPIYMKAYVKELYNSKLKKTVYKKEKRK